MQKKKELSLKNTSLISFNCRDFKKEKIIYNKHILSNAKVLLTQWLKPQGIQNFTLFICINKSLSA